MTAETVLIAPPIAPTVDEKPRRDRRIADLGKPGRGAAENFKPEATRYEIIDAIVPGLRLVVQPSGVKSWVVRYRFGTGKLNQRKLTLDGRFPAVTVATARDLARRALEQVACGTDPATVKKLGTAPDASFEAAADLYIKLHVDLMQKNPETGKDEYVLREGTRKYVTREIKRAKETWRGRTTRSIRKADIIVLTDLSDEAGIHAGNTTRKVLKAFFAWALSRDMIDLDPAAGLRKNVIADRERFLSDDEIKLVWQAAGNVKNIYYGALVRLLILSGCRRAEITGLRWDEIDGDYINLPAERTKTHEPHKVFIAPLMRSILDSLPRRGPFVLCSGKSKMSANDRAKTDLDALVSLKPAWRFHDLRRSFATGLQRLGLPIEIIERCLNHKLVGIQKIYNRHNYEPECRAAWEKWSDHVAKLAA